MGYDCENVLTCDVPKTASTPNEGFSVVETCEFSFQAFCGVTTITIAFLYLIMYCASLATRKVRSTLPPPIIKGPSSEENPDMGQSAYLEDGFQDTTAAGLTSNDANAATSREFTSINDVPVGEGATAAKREGAEKGDPFGTVPPFAGDSLEA